MILSLLIALLMPVSFADDLRTHTVLKHDGSVAQYKLLKVAIDHSRKPRREQTLLHLPSSHEIPHAKLPAVRDQGQRGTCAYFATVGLVETRYGSRTRLSEECLVGLRNWQFDQGSKYTGSDKPEQRPDPNGDYPQSIIQTVAALGIPVATRYSSASCVYNGMNTNGASISIDDYKDIVASSPNPASGYGKGLPFDLNTKPSIDSIRELIANNIPVEVAIFVYNSFGSTSDWAYDPSRDTEGEIAGGHAVILTGYETQNGETTFTFKNSWGSSWGSSGYGTMNDKLLKISWESDPTYDFTVAIH